MKGLEALRKIDYEARYVNTDDEGYSIEPYKATNFCEEEFNIIEKELKALNIIIDREVNIQAFRKHIDITDNYDDYCYFDIKHAMTISSTPLTEEEFYLLQEKLLKEVVINERIVGDN